MVDVRVGDRGVSGVTSRGRCLVLMFWGSGAILKTQIPREDHHWPRRFRRQSGLYMPTLLPVHWVTTAGRTQSSAPRTCVEVERARDVLHVVPSTVEEEPEP